MERRSFLRAMAATPLLPAVASASVEAATPEPSKWQGDGWYSHLEFTGTKSVWRIEQCKIDPSIYRAWNWPAAFNQRCSHVFDAAGRDAFICEPTKPFRIAGT